MGDVINTLPLLKTLKEEYGGCRVTMVCYKEFTALFEGSPLIDRFVQIRIGEIVKLSDFDASGKAADYSFPELVEEYDLAINLAYDTWPAKLISKLKARTKYGRIGSKKEEVRLLGDWMKYLFSFIHNRDYNLFNIIDIFTRSGGVNNRPVSGYLPYPEERDTEAATLLHENGYKGGRLIAFQVGASEAIRAWEVEKFAQLGRILKEFDNGIEIVITGSPAETALADNFLASVDYPVVNMVGKTGITDVPAVLNRCYLLVSNDTGPIHIAAAVGTRVLGIYFASAYFAETGPYGAGNVIIQSETGCYPCKEDCTCETWHCRDNLTTEAVAAVAVAILSDSLGESMEFNFPNLSVYRSRFLSNGSLIYAPVSPAKIVPQYIKGLLYRAMWENREDVTVYRHFIRESIPDAPESQWFKDTLEAFTAELNNLRQIFAVGAGACGELMSIFAKPGITQEALAGPLGQLNIIEQFLDKREEPLTPLKHFFSFVMMDMDYLQFPALAAELREKYLKLKNMAERFQENLLSLNQ